MANSTGPVRLNLGLSTVVTYLATVALIALALVGAFVVHIFPQFVGYTGLSTGILGLIAFLIQDLMSESVPTGWPVYTTFIVVSVVGAIEGSLGVVTSTTFLTLAAVLAWLLYVIQAVITYLNQDQGANIPLGTETVVITLLGLLVTALASIVAGPTGTTASVSTTPLLTGLTVTGIASASSYVFAKETALARRRAAAAKFPLPDPRSTPPA
jgi:hypothetical protein